jgi:hypothetical protein
VDGFSSKFLSNTIIGSCTAPSQIPYACNKIRVLTAPRSFCSQFNFSIIVAVEAALVEYKKGRGRSKVENMVFHLHDHEELGIGKASD